MKSPAQKNILGFTLVELLVVISIIAILSVIGIVVFSKVQQSGRDAKRKADIQAISRALELYYNANDGHYPIIPGSWGAVSCDGSWDTLASFLSPYMQTLPRDPQNDCSSWTGGKFYKYHNRYNPSGPNDGSSYQIAASLENKPGTGNFTLWCASDSETIHECDGTPSCWVQFHKDMPDCTFNQNNGGFGFDSQQ